MRMGCSIDDLQCGKIQVQSGCALSNLFRVSEEHRPGNPLVNQDATCAQNGWILSLWKYNTTGFRARFPNEDPGYAGIAAQTFLQAITVLLQVKVNAGNSRLHCGGDHSGRDANNNPGIEWLRDDVVRAKFKVVQPIDSAYRFGNVVLGQIRKSAGRREHHLFVDSSCARIERSTEDSREAKNIVHLIRVV